MKIIAIGAVTAGGKTTVVNELTNRLPRTACLHFDDYAFEGEVDDFPRWVAEGADYDVWDLSPLKADLDALIGSGEYDCILLDYPFAYRNAMLRDDLDCAVFIDTPLDIAMARRVLRDMKDASADEIRGEMAAYLRFARVAYVQMRRDILPSSDHVVDGAKDLEDIVQEIERIIRAL